MSIFVGFVCVCFCLFEVIDARHVRTAKEMFDCLLEHLKYATNGGQIRSTLTIFPKRVEFQPDFRIWNSQMISYAAYTGEDGSITGDPVNLEFTEVICSSVSIYP